MRRCNSCPSSENVFWTARDIRRLFAQSSRSQSQGCIYGTLIQDRLEDVPKTWTDEGMKMAVRDRPFLHAFGPISGRAE
jgi:hypothetical protein